MYWEVVQLLEIYPEEEKTSKEKEHTHSQPCYLYCESETKQWFGHRMLWSHREAGQPLPCLCRVRIPTDRYQPLWGVLVHALSLSHMPTSMQPPLPWHRRATSVPDGKELMLGSWPDPVARVKWTREAGLEGVDRDIRSSLISLNITAYSFSWLTN